MKANQGSFTFHWACISMAAGGILMAVFWMPYTNVHGPTSFDQTRELLGRSTLFWSLLLSIPPSLLIAAGMIILYPSLAVRVPRMVRIGYFLVLFSLIIPAGLDLFVWGGLGPPLFVPFLGAGLILLGFGSRRTQRIPEHSLYILTFMGISLIVAFLLALIPNNVSDQAGGYRIFGIFSHLLPGIGWVLLGVSLWMMKGQQLSGPSRNNINGV
jgi:hypothetical protein